MKEGITINNFLLIFEGETCPYAELSIDFGKGQNKNHEVFVVTDAFHLIYKLLHKQMEIILREKMEIILREKVVTALNISFIIIDN